MYSYMAYYFLLYSNTDSSLAVRKAVEFALTLRAYSVLYAVPLLKVKNQCCGSETKVSDPVSDPDPA